MNIASDIQPMVIVESFRPVLAVDGSITADRRIFEVRPASKQHRLLKALASKKNGIIRREDLVGTIYEDTFNDDPSRTLKLSSSRYQAAVKTLSRVRISLEKFFGDLTPPGFDWLPWNEKLGGWILFQQLPVDQARA